MNSYDALVIGGGLAGCMAAITLAQRGHRVALLEAGTYPRAKVCGEFYSPECAALFESIGFLPALHALHPNTIRTVRITAPDGTDWRSTLPLPAFGISRYKLDAALAAYAGQLGVDVRPATRAVDIEGDLERGFTVTAQTAGEQWRLCAAGVIAAHGKRSNLDRALKRKFFDQPQPYIGLKQHFCGQLLPEHLDLHVFPGGYCGISQVEEGRTNVCLLVEQAVFQAAGGRVEPFIAWMCQQNRGLGAWLADASPLYPDWLSIAQVPLSAKTPIEGNVLMAGDAAGMIAPLAGDGMAMALHSGRLAALALARFLDGQPGSAMLRSYEKVWRRNFRSRLQLGRTLHRVMIRPAVLSAGLRLLRQFPRTGDWLVRHTRDFSLLEYMA
ncbi:MAG: NAD(P)/FAD-dependent oxidoreductase [Chloroflexota bacterium]|nr:NAD(P)/FAD-dependent oxidoreductase [Chloroflexota bacterium]